MKVTTSRALFAITQELSASLSTEPQISSHVECFNLDKFYRPDECLPVLTQAIAKSFPDYDFSGLEQRHFRLIQAPEVARNEIAWAMSSRLGNGDIAWNRIYQYIEAEISPALCDIYSYEPDCCDAFAASGALWSICYLFFNAKDRKILLFHMREGAEEFEIDDVEDEDLEVRYGFSVF
jgi:hypothetical protein